jgi:hypothetical protein
MCHHLEGWKLLWNWEEEDPIVETALDLDGKNTKEGIIQYQAFSILNKPLTDIATDLWYQYTTVYTCV